MQIGSRNLSVFHYFLSNFMRNLHNRQLLAVSRYSFYILESPTIYIINGSKSGN